MTVSKQRSLRTLLLGIFLIISFTKANPLFTEAEKEWMKEHPTIIVANELDWPPFDFNQKGAPKGLSIDYIKLLAQKSGLQIEFVNGYSWNELITLFKEHKIDVMPVFYKNGEREEFTLYTDSYHEAKLGIFTHADTPLKSVDLDYHRIGMETSHGSIPLVKERIPNATIVEIDYKKDLVQQLALGEIDAIIGNPFVFYFHAKEMQINNIRVTDYINLSKEEQQATAFHIGIRKDWPLLHQILQKTMNSVTEDEMNSIKERWADIAIIEPVNWRLIIHVIGGVLLIMLFLLWHAMHLQKIVTTKTKELRELNEVLEIKVSERTKELYETNQKLTKSLEEIETLHGIIPICSSCKKIRDDDGYWNKLESYIAKHSLAQFSHGICPDCMDKLYPNIIDQDEINLEA